MNTNSCKESKANYSRKRDSTTINNSSTNCSEKRMKYQTSSKNNCWLDNPIFSIVLKLADLCGKM